MNHLNDLNNVKSYMYVHDLVYELDKVIFEYFLEKNKINFSLNKTRDEVYDLYELKDNNKYNLYEDEDEVYVNFSYENCKRIKKINKLIK
jgi:hypothetical protein